MTTSHKAKRYGFKNTLLTLSLWLSAVSYHIITFYLTYFSFFRQTPSSLVSTTVQGTIQNTVGLAKKTLIPEDGKPINPYSLALIVQILIYNIFFLLIYFLVNKANKKFYNPAAIYLVGVFTSSIFITIALLY